MVTDWKKKYEEALNKARELRDGFEGYNANVAIIAEIFPELAESEDERIRKELVAFFKEVRGDYWHDLLVADILAYLEKQKEQKEELSIRLNGVMQEYVKAGKDEEEQEHRLKCYQLFLDALSAANFFEQKEQKPAEWRDDDQKMLDKIVNIVIYAADTCRIINDDDVKKIESWIKKQVYANWKPTAEQLEAFELAVKWYSDNLGANPKLYDLEEDLKRL